MTPTAHVFRMMLKARRVAMGKGNRVQTRHRRSPAWLYPSAAERAYALQIRRWLLPLRRRVVAYLRANFEAMAKADRADALQPDCPGPDCPMCNGECCDMCGAGSWNNSVHDCDHDVIDRHTLHPDLLPPELPASTFKHRSVKEFITDLGQPFLASPVVALEPLVIRDVTHRDRVPGSKVTVFVQTTNGWVAQQWPAGGSAAPEIMMGLGDTAADILKANKEQWKKQTKNVLGLSFENTVGDWWPDLRDRWSSRNYDLIKNLAGDYIGRINDHVERAVTNGWSLQDLTEDIQGIGEGMSDRRARVIARDQVGKLNGQLTQAQQTEIGINAYLWDTAGDERVRGRPGGKYEDSSPSHWAMQGLLCSWDDATIYSPDNGKTWIPRTDDMPMAHPGDEIQCFPGNTPVRSPSRVRRIFRQEYSGSLIDISFMDDNSRGHFLATPNHPVLTLGAGWKPAKDLDLGDHIIKAPDEIFEAVPVIDIEDAISSLQELFDFCAMVFHGGRVVSSGRDFYGDSAIDKEIDVVTLEGELPDMRNAQREKSLMKQVLTRADICLPELPGDRYLAKMLLGLGCPAHSGIRLLGHAFSLVCGHSVGSYEQRFTRGARLESFLSQAAKDCGTGDSELLSYLRESLSRLIEGDDLGFGKLVSIVGLVVDDNLISTESQLPSKMMAVDAEALGDLAKRSSGFQPGMRVTKKGIVEFSSHVYTLDSVMGWYSIGRHSSTVRNCRCTALPYFADLVGVMDNQIDGEEAPAPPRVIPYRRPGGIPKVASEAMSFLEDTLAWKPLLARGFQKAAPEIARTGDLLVREFPVMKGAVTHIGEQNQVASAVGMKITKYFRENAFAWNRPLPNGKSAIGINFRTIGKDPASWKAQLDLGVAKGWHPQGTATFKSIIDHELAHAIDNVVGARYDDELYRLFHSLSFEEIAEGLSIYARTNIQEFIAEGWAEYRNNPRAREISRKIGDRITAMLQAKEKTK